MRARDTLFALLLTTAGCGLAEVAGEELLVTHLGAMQIESERQLADGDDWSSLPPAEAIKFFRKKELLLPGEFAALEDSYKAKGFSVAGLKMRYQLERTHEALSRAIEEGTTKREFIKEMGPLFDKWGVTSSGKHHLETIFDTNVLGAYGAGRFQQMSRPDVLAARPFWKYHTAGDHRVRPTHAAMNGRVIPADSPIWDEWYPPNGYRCRCTVSSLGQGDIDREGSKVDTALPAKIETKEGQVYELIPDMGFSGSPRTQARADAVVERLQKKTKASGMLRAPELTRVGLPQSEQTSTRPARPPVFSSAGDLLRSDDARRVAKVDALAGLAPNRIVELAKAQPFFNLYPAGELGVVPAGETWVEISLYSQNLDTAEQLVRRLAGRARLGALAERIELAGRASYGVYDPGKWPDPEVAYDSALKRALGLAEAEQAVRSTEAILRIKTRNARELAAAKELALQTDQATPGAVRRAWGIPDLRLRGDELAAQEGWPHAVLNRRKEGSGEQVVLSRTPLRGWDAETVAVNQGLYDFLPEGDG